MTYSERITEQFQASMETQQSALATLAHPIEAAATTVFNCIIEGKKVLTCGNGGGSALAQHFVANLLYCFEQERPGLPALALTGDDCTLTAIANGDSFDEVYARQVSALGQPGDTLLLISPQGNSINLMRAVQEAQDREISIISLTGHDGGELSTLLAPEDIEIRVPSASDARILELHLLIIHCLCDLIDRQLLGH